MKLVITLLGVLLMGRSIMADSVQGWEYQYKDYGGRNESISGTLLYNGVELPREFEHVITPVGEFFFDPVHGFAGPAIRWTPMVVGVNGERHSAVLKRDVEGILSSASFRKCETQTQGAKPSDAAYIPGKFEQRPKEAGPDWFYAVKLGWWINPQKIDQALKAMGGK